MRATNFRIIFCLLIFGLQLNAQDDSVNFEAIVSKKNLGLNENLRVDFKMNKDGDNFTPPNFEGFKVVGGPNQSVSNMWVNGKRTFSKSYSYFLSPLQKGQLKLGQATIEVDGKLFKTLPVNINVSESVKISKDPNDPSYVVNENLHLVAEVSNINPYVNEAISIVYKLYYSPQINVTNVGEVETPEFKNFWSQNIKIPRLQIERGSFKGDNYNYVTWKKTVLYPQKSGKLEILPLSLDVSVDVPTNRRDFFGNRIYDQVSKKVTAGKKIINVKKLPEGAPKNFNGAVGDFDLELKTTKSNLNASESLQAIVKVSGKGNLKLFSPPDLKVPSSMEKYEPEYKENISTDLSGMEGSISNVFTLVPQFQGNYPISPIEFSFFNTKSNKYETIYSKELIVNVMEGPISLNQINKENNIDSNLKNILPSIDQFKFIKTSTNLTKINTPTFIYSNTFYILLAIPFLIIVVLIIFFRSKKISKSEMLDFKSKRANKLAKNICLKQKIILTKRIFFIYLLKKHCIIF